MSEVTLCDKMSAEQQCRQSDRFPTSLLAKGNCLNLRPRVSPTQQLQIALGSARQLWGPTGAGCASNLAPIAELSWLQSSLEPSAKLPSKPSARKMLDWSSEFKSSLTRTRPRCFRSSSKVLRTR